MLNLRIIENWYSTEVEALNSFVKWYKPVKSLTSYEAIVSHITERSFQEGAVFAFFCVLQEAKRNELNESSSIDASARRSLLDALKQDFSLPCHNIPE